MNKETAESLNDSILIKATQDSYIKKEDLIKIIENLTFSEVESIKLSCITGYRIKVNDKGDKYVQVLGFDININ